MKKYLLAVAASVSRNDLPYKVATCDLSTKNYNIITSKWNFGEA